MYPTRLLLAALIALGGLVAMPAHAETFHTCGTVINSLPAVISTQGVYCLTKDLTTSITSGYAVDIQTNNVTIDCNGYKIGGLAGGVGSTAVGVRASATRLNIVVRNCGIRGYFYGISLEGGAGHMIEDNRLDNNLVSGIQVGGDNNRVQRNRVYDTGGAPGMDSSSGISASADVIDNTVAGVFATGTDTFPRGIVMNGAGTDARGNLVRDLAVAGAGLATAIQAQANAITVDGNRVSLPAAGSGWALYGNGATDTFCIGNTIANFSSPIVNCDDVGGNASH
jgi:parallel beta-helix repeat protein